MKTGWRDGWKYGLGLIVAIGALAVPDALALDTMLTAVTRDVDGDGRIDRIEVQFSGPVDLVNAADTGASLPCLQITPPAGTPAFQVKGYTHAPGSGLIVLDLVPRLLLADSGALPTVAYVPASGSAPQIASGGVQLSSQSVPCADGAPPVIVKAVVVKQSDQSLPQVDLTFSEPILDSSLAVAAQDDFEFLNTDGTTVVPFLGVARSDLSGSSTGDPRAAAIAIVQGSAVDDAQVTLLFLPASPNIPGEGYRIRIKSGSQLKDAAGNVSGVNRACPIGSGSQPQIAKTGAVFTGVAALDTDHDGKVDTLRLTFTDSTGAPVNVVDGSFDKTRYGGTRALGDYVQGGTVDGVADVQNDNVLYVRIAPGAVPDTGSMPSFSFSEGFVRKNSGTPAGPIQSDAALEATGTEIDKAPPAPVAAWFEDVDHNGKIDRVTVEFSEAISAAGPFPAGEWTPAGPPAGASVFSWSVSGSRATLVLAEGTAFDTQASGFKIGYGGSRIQDQAGVPNTAPAFSAFSPADKAPPVVTSAWFEDVDHNGKVDRVMAEFSEPLAAGGSFPAGDWTLGGQPAGVSVDSWSVSGSRATVVLLEGTAADTQASGFAISYDGSRIQDQAGVPNAAAGFGPRTLADQAPPVLLSARYEDSNHDGKVDFILAVFSEPLQVVSLTATTSVGEWSFLNSPAGSVGSVTVSASNPTKASINLTAGSVGTAPANFKISYTGSKLKDIAGLSAAATASPIALTDNAPPVLIGASTIYGGTNGSGNIVSGTVIQIAFSEPVTLGALAHASLLLKKDGVTQAVWPDGASAAYSLNQPSGTPPAGSQVWITLNSDTTGGGWSATAATFNLSGTVAALQDAANLAANSSPSALSLPLPIGAAPPVVSDAWTSGADPATGTVNRITVTFSNRAVKDSFFNAGLWNLSGGGTVTGMVAAPDGTDLLNDSTIQLVVSGLTAGDSSVKPTLSWQTGAIRSIDSARNLPVAAGSRAVRDQARPILLSVSSSKPLIGGNFQAGTVLSLAFSEAVRIAGTMTAAQWVTTQDGSVSRALPDGGAVSFADDAADPRVVKITFTAATTSGAWTKNATIDVNSISPNQVVLFEALPGALRAVPATPPSPRTAAGLDALAVIDAWTSGADSAGSVNRIAVKFNGSVLDSSVASSIGAGKWTVSGGTVSGMAAPSGTDLSNDDVIQLVVSGFPAGNTAVTPTVNWQAGAIQSSSGASLSLSGGSLVARDQVAPFLLGARMEDTDHDGRIDRVTAVFSEPLQAASGPVPSGEWTLANVPSAGSVSGLSVTDGSTEAVLTLIPGGTFDTAGAGFQVRHTGTRLKDKAGVTAAITPAASPIVPVDQAPPVVAAAWFEDSDHNGKIDRVVVEFSEPVATAGGTPAGAWTLGGQPAGVSLSSWSVSGKQAILLLQEGTAKDTQVAGFTIRYVGTQIRDLAGSPNAAVAFGPLTLADQAPPVPVSAWFEDSDHNGKIDRVVVVFSEPLAAGGPFPADAWTPGGQPAGVSVDSWSVSADKATLVLHEGAGADTRAAGFNIGYAGTQVRDSAGVPNAAAGFGPLPLTDKAPPVLVSASSSAPLVDGNFPQDAVLSLTFSEEVRDAGVAAGQLLLTQDGSVPRALPDGGAVSIAVSAADPHILKVVFTAATASGAWTLKATVAIAAGEGGDGLADLFEASPGTLRALPSAPRAVSGLEPPDTPPRIVGEPELSGGSAPGTWSRITFHFSKDIAGWFDIGDWRLVSADGRDNLLSGLASSAFTVSGSDLIIDIGREISGTPYWAYVKAAPPKPVVLLARSAIGPVAPTRVFLDASASFDFDGGALTFAWSVVQSPAGASITLENVTGATPSALLRAVGTYVFSVTAHNAAGLESEPKTAAVSIQDVKPVARPGPSRIVDASQTSRVVLDGRLSSDANGQPIAGYAWSFVKGPQAVSLDTPSQSQTGFAVPSKAGTYIFKLVVSDTLDSDPAFVSITVVASRHPPSADAGIGQTVRSGKRVVLDGHESADPDGTIQTYAWTPASDNPEAATLDLADPVHPAFTPVQPGIYRFTLVTTDDDGATSPPASVSITVLPADHAPPRTRCAFARRIAQAGRSVLLDASGTPDPDGNGLSFHWTQMEGPEVDLAGVDAAQASFVPAEAGIYRFRCVASTRASGIPTEVEVQVVSQPPQDLPAPPVASPKASARINLHQTPSVTLQGSDSTGESLTCRWEQIQGPVVPLTDENSSTASFRPTVSRVYGFRLTVTDSYGRSDSQPVFVTVDSFDPLTGAGNRVPTPAAKENVEGGVLKTVELDASASFDPDAGQSGHLLYVWEQVDGPVVFLEGADTAKPRFTPPVPGIYLFRVSVDDGADRSVPQDVRAAVTDSGGGSDPAVSDPGPTLAGGGAGSGTCFVSGTPVVPFGLFICWGATWLGALAGRGRPTKRFQALLPRQAEKGLALIIIVGLLTLLAVAGAAFMRFASGLRVRTGVEFDRTQARLLARSGVQYAAARLFQTADAPKPPAADNQADDWTYRDGAGFPLEKSLNPSYAQAEPYQDVVPNGKYDEGGDPYADLDHSGRFDSWSGRLRDRHEMSGGTFVLKVLGESGKINVNGGTLDTLNRNAWIGNMIPDHRDVEEPRNRRYVLLLDNLGQVVNVSSVKPAELQDGAASRLGDLLKKRPYKGFQSMGQVQGALAGLGWAGDWPKVKDFLTVTEIERAKFSVSDKTAMGNSAGVRHLEAEPRPLVNVSLAPRETLQALALGLSISLVRLRCIDPSLALKTADYLGQNRFASWYDLYAKLYRDNPMIDPDSAGYEDAVLALHEACQYDYATQSWATVVFGNLLADEVGGYGWGYAPIGGVLLTSFHYRYYWSPPMSWHTYDLPHASASNPPRFHQQCKMGPSEYGEPAGGIGSIERRQGGRPPLPTALGTPPFYANLYQVGTLETSLIPREVSALSIDCLGRSRTGAGRPLASSTASATFRFGTIVSARTQAEFENLLEADRGRCRVIGRPFKDRTQTEPQFSIDSIPADDPVSHVDLKSYMQSYPGTGLYLYSPFWGTIRLADRSGYRNEDRFYVPAWDADQPLRPPIDPALLQNGFKFGDNFKDVSGPSEFAYKWFPVMTFCPSSEALFRGERATSFNCAAAPGFSAPGTYTWPIGKKFALDDGKGNVTRGTVELWSTGRPGGLTSQRLGLYWAYAGQPIQPDVEIRGDVGDGRLFPAVMCVNGHRSRLILVGDWHHLAVVLDSESTPAGTASSMVGYLDGIPDPFLANDDWAAGAINAARPPEWDVAQGGGLTFGSFLGSEVDELRLYDKALGQAEAMARGQSSRYWTEEQFPQSGWPPGISERLRQVPSFTSSLYLFDQPVVPEGARWDGFVPQLIREAVDGPGGPLPSIAGPASKAAPIKVELFCWDHPPKEEEPPQRTVPFPEGLWRTGGGWADFKAMWKSAYGGEPIPKFRAFRYKVWMDCSAIDGFNGETPVFDSISMAFRTGAKLLDAREE